MREFKVGDKVKIKSNFRAGNTSVTGKVIEIVESPNRRAKVEWDFNREFDLHNPAYKYRAVYDTWELELLQNGVERMIECLQ
jgi:hypothetical protein